MGWSSSAETWTTAALTATAGDLAPACGRSVAAGDLAWRAVALLDPSASTLPAGFFDDFPALAAASGAAGAACSVAPEAGAATWAGAPFLAGAEGALVACFLEPATFSAGTDLLAASPVTSDGLWVFDIA